jgi:anaerobic ribonucleoside-triphosphate reductase activating protein
MKGDVFMRYASIRDMDVVNGIGIACSLFVQGCLHHCYNCFNQETWDFNKGKEWTQETENKFIELCKKPFIDCVSILGGEPFQQGEDFYELLKKLKHDVNKPIFVWTGYKFEEIMESYPMQKCLIYIDYLIDGKYIDSLKDYKLSLRGSSNQRIIDIKNTFNNKNIEILDI